MNKEFKWKILVISFFILFFLIGIITVKDYGISSDEKIERNHSIVNHYYLRSVMKGKISGKGKLVFNSKTNLEKLMDKENIDRRIFKYKYKYYGVALQIPQSFIEQLFNYQLDVSNIYYMRHICNFLIFFISTIYFYKLLSSFIIKEKKFALLATLFLILSPRIYGDSFYNNKDLIFLSLVIINIYYSLKYLNKPNKLNTVLLCFISALAINCRVIGGFIIFLTIIFRTIKNKKEMKKTSKDFLILFILTYAIYILITPASWNNPIKFPFKVLSFFFNYDDPFSHKLQKCFYFGSWISSEKLPWHYLPVWIFITTPILYTILFIIGFLKENISNIKNKFKNTNQELLFCNIILVFMILFIVILRPTLYTGWRHFYFLYPIIIINSIVGLKYLIKKIPKLKIILIVIIVIHSVYVIGWMIKNHPYQYEYFELFIRKQAINNFETNYWKVSNSDAIKEISNITNKKVTVYSPMEVSSYVLNKERRENIKLVSKNKNPDFIIDNSMNKTDKYNEYYEEVAYKEIDGYRLYTIYQKK